MDTYTREQIEAGCGRYTDRRTTVIQQDSEDVFRTEPADSGWRVAPGWHVAGSMGITTDVEWCDLW
jgi:hypothetical protein